MSPYRSLVFLSLESPRLDLTDLEEHIWEKRTLLHMAIPLDVPVASGLTARKVPGETIQQHVVIASKQPSRPRKAQTAGSDGQNLALMSGLLKIRVCLDMRMRNQRPVEKVTVSQLRSNREQEKRCRMVNVNLKMPLKSLGALELETPE